MSPVLRADPICESRERNAGLGGVAAGVVGVVVEVEVVDAALGVVVGLEPVLVDGVAIEPLNSRLVTVS